MIENKERTMIQSKIIFQLYKEGRKILAPSDRIHHVVSIEKCLLELGVEEQHIGRLYDDKRCFNENTKILLSTYAQSTQGLNVK
jgi:hypothetical protein